MPAASIGKDCCIPKPAFISPEGITLKSPIKIIQQ